MLGPPHMSTEDFFVRRFGDLVALLRADPANDAAQDLALETCAALTAKTEVTLVAGVEVLGAEDPLSLKHRLLTRHVDMIHIRPGATAEELLQLARALAHDSTPVVSSEHIAVELVPVLISDAAYAGQGGGPAMAAAPVALEFTPTRDGRDRRREERRAVLPNVRYRGPERRRGDRRQSGERRVGLVKDLSTDLQRVHQRLERAVREGSWMTALQAAHSILRMLGMIPGEERRSQGIALRRALPRPALDGIVALAVREPAESARAAELLRWVGLDAADAMLAMVMETEGIGTRRILFEILGTMPEAMPLLIPFLKRGRPHEVRHAATILGALGRPEAIAPLKERLQDPDERVRAAVVHALAEFPMAEVSDSLRQALASSSPPMRVAAAEAIGRRKSGAFAMPLMNMIEGERDAEAFRAAVRSLGLLGVPDAVAGLVQIATAKRSLLSGKGYSAEQRVEAVRALAASDAPVARAALERLAREGDGPVKEAARQALMGGRRIVI